MTLVVVLAHVFGVSWGVVMSHARGPGGTGLLAGAASLLLLVGVAGALALDVSSTLTPAVAGVAAYVLSGAYVWRRSPLLDGEGYWFRVWFVLKDRGDLQAAEDERQDRLAAST
ncbi:hypothetical protein WDZ17_09745 [Pseudokineococcus basanitobsidens]|uniref:Uncharacterized protein n=1 Tax=Pseudokineococcus basanitobsidens TaxID=1926649 RepID=A0ABU8RKU4_9ACTN